jgi:hypothetical protein
VALRLKKFGDPRSRQSVMDGSKFVSQPQAPAALYSPETLLFLTFPVLISVRG